MDMYLDIYGAMHINVVIIIITNTAVDAHAIQSKRRTPPPPTKQAQQVSSLTHSDP